VGEELVRSPGQVTLTCYAACPDITRTVTPDLKHPGKSFTSVLCVCSLSCCYSTLYFLRRYTGEGLLLYIDLGEGNYRLGGTALSTVYQQLGDACADMSPSALDTFRRCFHCIQQCLSQGLIQTGHDRSDGGLVTTLLEMAFAGNVGIEVTLREEWLRTAQESFPSTTETKLSGAEAEGIPPPAFMALGFGEEAGFVLEVLPENLEQVLSAFEEAQVEALLIGRVVAEPVLYIEYERLSKECVVLLNGPMQHWRDVWEATSFALELRQCDADCVRQEAEALRSRTAPPSHLSFTPVPSPLQLARTPATHQPRVAVLRQEGTNGDREMLSAFHTTGFEAWDVNMHDLLAEKVDLAMFRGVVFCGGFSYADVNDSAKGWAAGICFNPRLLQQFTTFRERVDTFSLGVCNGCQLMALLGWVPFEGGVLPSGSDAGGCDQEGGGEVVKVKAEEQARFVHNASGRFESRWSAVQVLPSPAVLLQGMEGSTLGEQSYRCIIRLLGKQELTFHTTHIMPHNRHLGGPRRGKSALPQPSAPADRTGAQPRAAALRG
jgi:phosphoribosylformylglycinamidine synthase